MGFMDSWNKGAQAGREQRQNRTLRQFLQPATQGDKGALSSLYSEGLGEHAMQAQSYAANQAKSQQEAQQAAYKELGSLASGVVQAAQGGDQARLQGSYQALVQKARQIDPNAPISDQYDPADLPHIHKLIAMGGGQAEADEYTLSPGAKRFRGNQLVAEAPFAPIKPEYQLYDGADGPSWIPKPTGAPQGAPTAGPSGGAAGMMDSAYNGASSGNFLDDVRGIVSPLGGRITSTTGGKHNPGSKHYSGNAIDIGMGRETPEQQAQILAALQANPNLIVRDERTRPPGQKVWSGPHLHAERRGQPGGINAIPIAGVRPKPKANEVSGGKGSDFQLVTLPSGEVVSVNKITGASTPVRGVTNANATSQREDQKQIAKLREKLPTMTALRDQLLEAYNGLKSGKYSTGAENALIPDALQGEDNQYLATVLNAQILEMATDMKGALSDKDVAFLKTGTTSLNKGEGANMAIIGQKLKVLNEGIKRAQQRTGNGNAPSAPASPAGWSMEIED